MGLETGTYINSLDAANPLGSDPKSAGDDHIRLLKSTIKATFPNITGALTATHTQLNYVTGVTSAIQAQLDGKQAAGSYQPLDAQLTTLAGITAQQATDLAAVSTFMGTVLNDADAATARATLGAGTGTVTSVSGTAPVSVATGTTTPVISMAAATASVNGYMTSTYAAKLDGIAAGANVGFPTDAGAMAVGIVSLCWQTAGVAVNVGATIAGSSLEPYVATGSGTGAGSGSTAATGTWRNVGTIQTNPSSGIGGLFQRIA